MRGSIDYQVQAIFHDSGIRKIGQSKHQAKEQARKDGAKTWAQIGWRIGIFSYKTADAYRDVWRQILTHSRDHFQIKDIERLTGEIVGGFLEEVIDRGVAHATFQQYAAAGMKLEQALRLYAERHQTGCSYSFRYDIDQARAEAHAELSRFDETRAYLDPVALVASVSDSDHQLAASLQHEGGPRIYEVAQIRSGQLLGYKKDPVTGQTMGVFAIYGKGGKYGEKYVTPPTYDRLEQRIRVGEGVFKIDRDKYRDSIKAAAAATGQPYNGSHGLRWNYVQERMETCQACGMTYEAAMASTSRDIGHERAEITGGYMK